MKKIGVIRTVGILLITFGIIFLDFENLEIASNSKAYVALILGVIVILPSLFYLDKTK